MKCAKGRTPFSAFLLNRNVNEGVGKLFFLDRNRVLVAHLNAGLAAKTLFGVHGNSLSVLKLVNFDRANVHAFAVTDTLVGVNIDSVTHGRPPYLLMNPRA
jgi:hypothetical protein